MIKMKDKTSKFFLFRGDDLLGVVTQTYDDFPWHHGSFEPSPEFYAVKELFDKERTMLERTEFDVDHWENVWEEIIRPGLRLVPVDSGNSIDELLILIDGTETWWRC